MNSLLVCAVLLGCNLAVVVSTQLQKDTKRCNNLLASLATNVQATRANCQLTCEGQAVTNFPENSQVSYGRQNPRGRITTAYTRSGTVTFGNSSNVHFLENSKNIYEESTVVTYGAGSRVTFEKGSDVNHLQNSYTNFQTHSVVKHEANSITKYGSYNYVNLREGGTYLFGEKVRITVGRNTFNYHCDNTEIKYTGGSTTTYEDNTIDYYGVNATITYGPNTKKVYGYNVTVMSPTKINEINKQNLVVINGERVTYQTGTRSAIVGPATNPATRISVVVPVGGSACAA